MQIREEEDWIVIDGVKVEGHITDECCSSCAHHLVYHETDDLYFCAFCNRWTEGAVMQQVNVVVIVLPVPLTREW